MEVRKRGCERSEHRAVTASQRRPWIAANRSVQSWSCQFSGFRRCRFADSAAAAGRSVERARSETYKRESSKAAKLIRGSFASAKPRPTPSEGRTPGRVYRREAIVTSLAPRNPTTLIEVVCSVANDRSDRGATAPQGKRREVSSGTINKGPLRIWRQLPA